MIIPPRVFLVSVALGLALVPVPAPEPHIHHATVAVRFQPGGRSSEAIVAELVAARCSVRVAAYVLTSEPIATALIAAHARGVDVRVVLDSEERNSRSSRAKALEAAGIRVRYDAKHRIMHEKVIVIDSRLAICGSYNFSAAAEKYNAECMLMIRDEDVAEEFLKDWQTHDGHGVVR